MNKTGTVLLVENNADDARLAQLAFERAGVRYSLIIVADGTEAMHYLKGRGKYSDRERYPFPQLILLDLGMPGVSGFEMLERLRGDPEVQNVPVTILSGSNYSPDVQRALELGAKSFLEKPSDLGKFSVAMKEMVEACQNSRPL
jgi:CheY-like chemotaxis protein